MPKIRGVKPDYWTDEDVVELSIPARLLNIGLWSYACDNGHLKDKPKQIKMRLMPSDDVSVADLLHELESADEPRIIRANGWIVIPNFTKHQKPDKRYFLTCEKDGCERPAADSQPGTRGGHDESTTGARRKPAARSKGPHVDGDGDGELMVKVKVKETPRASHSETDDRFDEFWNTYAHKIGRKKAHTAYKAALKKPGVTADLLIAAAASYITWQMSEGKHPQFTKHPATWLNGEHWADERVARSPQMGRVGQHLALARRLQEAEQPTHPQIGPAR